MIKALTFLVLFFLVFLALLVVGKAILKLDKEHKYTFLKLAAFAAKAAILATLLLTLLVLLF